MRILSILFLCGVSLAQAQNAGTPRQFDRELSVVVPPGWTETLLNTKPPERAVGNNPFENPDGLSVLLQARPADSSRTALVTVLRDHSFPGYLGHMERRNLQLFLSETAMLKGFRTQKFISREQKGEKNESIVFAEVVGVSLDGRRRNFTCLSFGRDNYNVRVHFEYDEADLLGRNDMNTLLASVVSNGVRVAATLASAAATEVAARAEAPSTNPIGSAALPPGSVPDVSSAATARPTPGPVAASPVTPPQASPGTFGAAPAAPGSLSEKTRLFVEKFRNCLVVVEGSKGKGSGFVCTLDGQPAVLTNTHVLAGNPQPRFTTMDGAVLQPTSASLAVEHDICKLPLPSASSALEVMDASTSPKIGDAIAVLGNSEGAGVIKPLEGTIVGIGPNLIEVNAPFVPGNSGSPIVHLESGKVIGIATYLVTRKVNETSAQGMDTEVRRFGYRIDSAKSWEPVVWPRFYAQSDQVNKILSVGEEFAQFLAFLRDPDRGLPQFGNSAVRRAVETFQSRLSSSRRMSAVDMQNSQREFLSNLRAATRSDIASFDTRTSYDYFRRQVADETKFRDALYQAFTKSLNDR